METVLTDYFSPPQWHYHRASLLQWPSQSNTLAVDRLKKLEEVYCHIIEELHFYEPIHLFVEDLKSRNRVMQKLSTRAVDLDRIQIHQFPMNGYLLSNSRPVLLKKGDNVVLLDSKTELKDKAQVFENGETDLNAYMAQKFGFESVDLDVFLNPGSIEVNGTGPLLTTDQILDHPPQPSAISKSEMEVIFNNYLGADQVIWLQGGPEVSGVTPGVAKYTRWLNDQTVLAMIPEDSEDNELQFLMENVEELSQVKLRDGKRLAIGSFVPKRK